MGLGLRAAAKSLGISHVALLKAKKAGRVTAGADGSFDVEVCRAELAKNSNPGKQQNARAQQRNHVLPSAEATEDVGNADPLNVFDTTISQPEEPGSDATYNEACRRLEWIKVQRAQLELDRKRAELVPLVEVNAYIAGMIAKARDILLRIDCDDRTKREIERALRELAKFEADTGS